MKLTRVVVFSAFLVGAAPGAFAASPRVGFAGVFCGDEASVARDFVALPAANGILSEQDLGVLNSSYVAGETRAAKATRKLMGSTIRGGWCAAAETLAVEKRPLDLVVSSAGAFTGAGGDKLADQVTFIARPLGNAETAAALKAGTLKKPGDVEADPFNEPPITLLKAALADRAKMLELWSKRDDVVLAGSAPGELYAGDKARKTYAAWKLDLKLVSDFRWGYVSESSERLAWAVVNVEAPAAPTSKTPAATYRVMFVMLADNFESDADAAPEHDTWHLVLAHFALVE